MQDLTHDAQAGGKAYLVPSSMNGGNTTSDDPGLAMTAPGSVSILPVADKLDVLPLPQVPDDQMPVSHPGTRDKVTVESAAAGNIAWKNMSDVPASGRWKQT